jgi:phosphatidylglycerophosphate synthase
MNEITQLRKQYTPDKISVDKENPVLYYVLRPLSFYLTIPCIKMGLSANQVTFIGMGIGIAGCLMLGLGVYWSMIVGAILLILNDVCDVVDGNIARYNNTSSTYGGYLDDVISGEIIPNLVPFAVGIGIGEVLLGSLCSLFMFSRVVVTEGYSAKFKTGARSFYKSGSGLWALVYRIGIAVSVSMAWALLIGAITNTVYWVLIFWTLLVFCEFIAATTFTLIKAKNDKE